MKRIVTLFLLLILVGQGAMAQSKKEQIAALQHSVDSLTGKIEMLEQQLAQRTEENNQLTQKLASAMQNVAQLEQSLRESKDAQQKLQREMDARVAELNHQIDSLRDQLSKLQTPTILRTPDLTFFELQGPVKKVKWDDDSLNYVGDAYNKFGQEFEFDKKGNLIRTDFVVCYLQDVGEEEWRIRDDDWRISEVGTTSYKWDSQRVTGYSNQVGNYDYCYPQTSCTYDERGLLVKEEHIHKCMDGRNIKESVTYEYQSIDKYGNWTKRAKNLSAPDGKESSVQTRTIEYYGEQLSEFEKPDIPAGYQIIDKYGISGHPQYAYAIVLSKGDPDWDGTTKAIAQFYDNNGAMVKSFNGEVFVAEMKGFGFSTKNLNIGIVVNGMDYLPWFEENGKSYYINWFKE